MKLLKKCLSIISAVVISVCSFSMFSVSGEGEEGYYSLSFDLDGGATVTDFETISVKGGSSIIIPDGVLAKDGYFFSGWTYNNYTLYEGGDAFLMPEGDTVLVPVWADENDKELRTVSYDDEGCESVGTLDDTIRIAGRSVVITKTILLKEGYSQLGWTNGEYVFQKGEKMIVPDHDVVLSPVWFKNYNIYYEAGDVDNVVGGNVVTFEKTAFQKFELADSTRLARRGYNLVGWKCDVDGVEYLTGQTFTMPDSEVHFTAIWKPLQYDVKFAISTSNSITISASYGDTITVPRCPISKAGYTFGGWTYKDEVYQAGEQFEIPALLKGEKIVFGCNWIDNSLLETEEINSMSVVSARRKLANGEITIEEVQEQIDFVLCK